MRTGPGSLFTPGSPIVLICGTRSVVSVSGLLLWATHGEKDVERQACVDCSKNSTRTRISVRGKVSAAGCEYKSVGTVVESKKVVPYTRRHAQAQRRERFENGKKISIHVITLSS
jgi:hypothetical protein